MNLPEQRRAPRRSPALSPKRLLAILTPLAAVAAVVVALVSTGDMGSSSGDQAAGGGAATAESQSAQDNASPESAGSLFRAVAGPADQVAAELRSKGIDATAVNGRVEVRGASRREIDEALGRRKAGDVQIIIVS